MATAVARELAKRAPKAPGSFDRCVPLETSLALIPELRARFGITRLADITYLDRAAVPVFSALVPQSPDSISVYNGKGLTAHHARIGAVMEAVERQSASLPSLPATLRGHGGADALAPASLGLPDEVHGEPLDFVAGYDVLRERETFVPLAAVLCPWPDETSFLPTSTNGLAAGNTLVEASYHALFEIVERHIFSLAHARGHVRPRNFLASICGSTNGSWVEQMVDDPVGRMLQTPTGEPAFDEYLERIESAGLTARVIVVEEQDLPPLAVATVTENGARRRVHLGLGCSWSPLHAVVRATTEAMQSRVADAAAAREDLSREGALKRDDFGPGRYSRLPLGRWYFDAARHSVALAALPDRSSNDVCADVKALVAALERTGVTRIVTVDMTPPGCPVSVVRVVAPELETAFVDGRVGPTISALLAAVPKRFSAHLV